MIHFDSSFLIDLQRELLRERPAAAFDLIESFDPDGTKIQLVSRQR
jgi:hypothetical protein